MKDSLNRRAELADFLKTRRARLRPEQFSLPTFTRRRTPGLRRDELAQLVGVGVSWYTWLEQGRDINVSAQLLERLAQVLQLDWSERRHLFVLAQSQLPVEDKSLQETTILNPGYQAVLDGLGSCPAYIMDRRSNIVAWNECARRLFPDFLHFLERDCSMVHFLFLHPSARTLFVNWERSARWCIASLRARSDRYADEEWFIQLVASLKRASPEFRLWWAQHDVQLTCDDIKELNHPQVGRLMLRSTTFNMPQEPEMQMIVYTPLPEEETAAKLHTLMSMDLQPLVVF